MGVLSDCAQKTKRLLEHVESVQAAYDVARDAYDRLDTNQPFDMDWLTLSLQVGGQQIPIPVSRDRATVQSYFMESINYLAGQLAVAWTELHNTSLQAVTHIQQATAQADAAAAAPAATQGWAAQPQELPAVPYIQAFPPPVAGPPATPPALQGPRIPTVSIP